MKIPYRLAADTIGTEEIEAAKKVLDSMQLTMGANVAAFEREFAEWTGAKYALMVNSGSSSNLLMVETMLRRAKAQADWKAGDEVLVPALSWPTTVWPLVQLGLVPVFVDCDPVTLAIDLKSARTVLTPRTKGMFLIHVLGHAPDMDEYLNFCESNGITLLEDTCESLGAHYNGRQVGTLGKAGSYSLYYSHHISSMEGGMIVTNDLDLFDDLKSVRAHGWVRDRSDKDEWTKAHPELDPKFMFILSGYNVRPTEVQAAIARVQLKKLDTMLEARERLANQVHGWTQQYAPWLKLLGSEWLENGKVNSRRDRRHSWMTFPFLVDAKAPMNVEQLKKRFEEFGVDTRPIIAGNLTRHPAMNRIVHKKAQSLKQCDELLSRGFMIGCHPVVAPGALETLEGAFKGLKGL